MAKIYVASSWRNEYQQAVVQLLRKYGHEVYDFKNPAPGVQGFSWSSVDVNWKNWEVWQYIDALKHPMSERHFTLDFDGMKWADVCVLLLPSGKSAHTEAGWMKGAGKKVYAVIPESMEAELMYKLFDEVFDDVQSLIMHLAGHLTEREVSNG